MSVFSKFSLATVTTLGFPKILAVISFLIGLSLSVSLSGLYSVFNLFCELTLLDNTFLCSLFRLEDFLTPVNAFLI